MNQGKLVFSQLTALLPKTTFQRCVDRYGGNHKVKDFSCFDQFLVMVFAQLTYRESLRDIELNLRAHVSRLYHMGLRCNTVSRNTLSNANATRPWQIYADFAQHLIGIARPLYAGESLAVDWTRRSTRSTRRPSTSVCRCTRGHLFANTRRPSSCIRCSICGALFLRLSI